MKDRELIEDFLKGDRDAFNTLMSRYQRMVFYTVKSAVLNTEDAKDITQQAFIKAFQNLRTLKKKDQFKSWLMTVAMNCAKDHLRKKCYVGELMEGVADGGPSVEGLTISRDTLNRVMAAMRSLPTRQRMIIGMRLFREMDFAEIGEILKIKSATVRSNFHFGMKNLRINMEKEGIYHEE